MNNLSNSKSGSKPVRFILLFVLMLGFTLSCKKMKIDKNDLRDFQQVNLVSSDGVRIAGINRPYHAQCLGSGLGSVWYRLGKCRGWSCQRIVFG